MDDPRAPDIDPSFVRQFETEVLDAYHRNGSKLRATVRSRNGVTGATTVFQGIDEKHSRPVECVLSDWYAGEWIDKLDELKQEHGERRVAVNAGAWALGRKTNEQILAALDATPNMIAAGGAGLTKAKIYEAFEMLGDSNLFEEGHMFALVGYQQWTNLLDMVEFASADYVGKDEIPWLRDGAEAKRWMGTLWMTHSGLPVNHTTRRIFWYRGESIGHASGSEVVTDITWYGDRAAYFVNNLLPQGACLVEPAGVVEIHCTEQ